MHTGIAKALWWVALASAFLLAACGGSNSGASSDGTLESDSESELRRALADESSPEFATDPVGGRGRIACVDGQEVRVFEFQDTVDRAQVSDALDPDDPSWFGSTSVAWSGTPRFWVSEAWLIMYAGPEPRVVERLEEEFGPAVAARGGRAADADSFAC